jgi:hypothetical protein
MKYEPWSLDLSPAEEDDELDLYGPGGPRIFGLRATSNRYVLTVRYRGEPVFVMRTYADGSDPLIEFKATDDLPGMFPLKALIDDANRASAGSPLSQGED